MPLTLSRTIAAIAAVAAGLLAAATGTQAAPSTPPRLTVAADGHYLLAGGKPFFWMGDTGWLLLSRLDRADTETYLATRERQGFNVVQVMILHPGGGIANPRDPEGRRVRNAAVLGLRATVQY